MYGKRFLKYASTRLSRFFNRQLLSQGHAKTNLRGELSMQWDNKYNRSIAQGNRQIFKVRKHISLKRSSRMIAKKNNRKECEKRGKLSTKCGKNEKREGKSGKVSGKVVEYG